MQPYVVLEKKEGQTPLECAEGWRAAHPQYREVPLAYAGRLDPMASGKLLVLIGDECKNQTAYHGLDKEYQLHILLGVSSDTGDILGLVKESAQAPTLPSTKETTAVLKKYRGAITLPYPAFSAKTLQGKPLHMWTLEGRLNEIEMPTYTANLYRIGLLESPKAITRQSLCAQALKRIELPTSTQADERKKLGNDFRRPAVRAAWGGIRDSGSPTDTFGIVTISCSVSSGAYMRTLAELIAKDLGTSGLAYRIVRTRIGRYQRVWDNLGFWKQQY